jgi:hypothetical protein
VKVLSDFVRKELKIESQGSPSSWVFEEESSLESRLTLVKKIFKKVGELIENGEETHVSFHVFETISTLGTTDISDYHKLDCLIETTLY